MGRLLRVLVVSRGAARPRQGEGRQVQRARAPENAGGMEEKPLLLKEAARSNAFAGRSNVQVNHRRGKLDLPVDGGPDVYRAVYGVQQADGTLTAYKNLTTGP